MSKLTPLAAALIGLAAAAQAQTEPQSRIVLELYTSQGCNSCPPADALLGKLATRPGVLALSFHVDYWNYLGWADPFSLKAATERQRAYQYAMRKSSMYTPQMVVGGRWEGVGSAEGDIERALRNAPRPSVPVILERLGAAGIKVSIDAAADAKGADIILVLFDRQHTTRIARGENSGKTLTYHHVVREIRTVGNHMGERFEWTVATASQGGQKRGGAAVLVQRPKSGPILGAAMTYLD
jgi:hypothetical protein